MEKNRGIFILVFVTAFFMASIPFGHAAEKTYKIRLSLYWPPQHHLVKASYHLAKCVQERTKGKLIVEVYPSGQLYSQKESLKAVSMGTIEMSDELMMRADVIDPIFSLDTNNEGILTTYEMGWAFLDHPVYRKIIEEAFARKLGVKPVMQLSSATMNLLTNSKRPLQKPADMKGLLIRASSKASAERIEILGAKSVIMPSDEQIMALERKTVDGAWTSLGDGVARRIWEVQKYGTVFQTYMILHPFLINVKFLNNLPADLRKEFESCCQNAQAYGRKLLEDEEKEMLATLKSNMEVYVMTSEVVGEWEKFYGPLVERWLQKTGDKGKEIRELMIKIRQENLVRKK
jgi:C4-dicarboxylate-binding protein DctP